ncbi:hypothetical protein KBC54_04485 [Patescibacteria group bacterium]|nr:hypothetical protein [Patescibacteria group bacterium]
MRPSNFKDRSWYKRWFINLLVMAQQRQVKAVCCKTFEQGRVACKGCPTVYDVHSDQWIYRFIGRMAKRKKIGQ